MHKAEIDFDDDEVLGLVSIAQNLMQKYDSQNNFK